jgi:hypothetical protein
MKPGRSIFVTVWMAACLAAAIPLAAQQAIPVEEWKDSAEWPLFKPGEFRFDSGRLPDLRLTFDARFPAPDRQLHPTTMVLEVFHAYFRGKPAIWIQWTSVGSSRTPNSTAAPDLILVDQETFATLFRIAGGPGPRNWAGSFNVVHYGPSQIVNLHTEETGTTETKTSVPKSAVFEFATFQFLFPFMELKEGRRFRLPTFERITHSYEDMPLLVGKQVQIKDPLGREHAVWPVYYLNPDAPVRVTWLVSPEAPYFYGWRYERTTDGKVFLEMTLRDWIALNPAVE